MMIKLIKYLNWSAIIVLGILMIMLFLLDYHTSPIFLIIPILINFLLLIWASSIKKSDKESDKKFKYIHWFKCTLLLLVTLIFLIPAVVIGMDTPRILAQFPVHYSKENIALRKADRLAKQRSERLQQSIEACFKRFQNQEAPIENGVWVYGTNYIVPCKNGKIHGEVLINNGNNSKKTIHFNQGEIAYLESMETGQIVDKIFRDESGKYQQIVRNEVAEEGTNKSIIYIDTIPYSSKELKQSFWY